MAAVVVALGALMLVGASDIALGVGYDRVGPRAFPYGVGGGLVALGLALALSRSSTPGRGEWTHGDLGAHGAVRASAPARPASHAAGQAPVSFDRLALATLGCGLVAFVLLLEPAGFIVAAAVQFVLAARAFQSKVPLRDALLGLAMAAIVYMAFTSGLGAALPAGWLASGPR
jgi:putative tricarboxylic transport membrane protein